MEVINLKEIAIPSINKRHNFNPRTGRFFTVKEHIKFKEMLQQVCRRRMLPPPYRVGIRVEMYKDIDNIEKPILDSLQGICIDNDRNVLEKYTLKVQRKRGTRDNLIVWVETIQPNDDFFPFKE